MSETIPVRRSPPFWAIADHDKKKTIEQKIREGIADYVAKFGFPPKYCLCSVADAAEVTTEFAELSLQPRTYMRRNVMYLGQENWE